MFSLIEVCCYKEATEPRVPDGRVEVITSKVLRSSPYVPLVVFTIWCFPHTWLVILFVRLVTLRVPLLYQELHPSEYMSLSQWGVYYLIFSFLFCCLHTIVSSFYVWSLYCMSFDLRLLNTPIDSNFSYQRNIWRVIKMKYTL